MAIKKETLEILKELDGAEVWSMKYEGCVFIEGNKVIKDGKKIDTLNTGKKIIDIFDEYYLQEI